MSITTFGSRALFALALILAVSAFGANPARAAQFTYIVPVTVQDIRSDWDMHVECHCTAEGGGNYIGMGQSRIPVTNGAYSGVVKVQFDARPGKHAADAWQWNCLLRKNAAGGGVLESDAAAGTQHNRGDHGIF